VATSVANNNESYDLLGPVVRNANQITDPVIDNLLLIRISTPIYIFSLHLVLNDQFKPVIVIGQSTNWVGWLFNGTSTQKVNLCQLHGRETDSVG